MQWSTARQLRILDLDTECRPMHYSEWRDESQITAIAWSWVGQKRIHCRVLEQDLSNEKAMLADFLEAYNAAGIITGHYLRRHDLPLLNDHCMRLGFPLLKPMLVSDTMADLPKVKGLGKSQENLSSTFGIEAPKHGMGGHRWRVANTLDPAGRGEARERVTSDVVQNKELRAFLLGQGWLKPPKLWRP